MIDQLKPYVTDKLGPDYLAGIRYLNKIITLRFNLYKSKYEDLASAGVEIVLKLLKRYSPNTGCKFTTYIYYRLPQSLLRTLNKEDYFISYPTHYKWQDPKYTFVPDFTVDKDGRECEINIGDDGEEACKMDIMAQSESDKNLLYKLLKRLTSRDRGIIKLRYGFTGKQFSRKEIANIYGISENDVRIRLQSSMTTMRRALKRMNKGDNIYE